MVQMPSELERQAQMADERVEQLLQERQLQGAAFGLPQRDTREWHEYVAKGRQRRYEEHANPLTTFRPALVH